MRLGAYLFLLMALALHFALALLDPFHAAEYDPWHDHIVIGGNAIERAQALAAHRDDVEQPHHHAPLTGRLVMARAGYPCDADAPHVIAITSQPDGAGAPLFGVASQDLLPSDWHALLEMPLHYDRLLTLTFLPPSGLSLPPCEPPPRAFSIASV